MGEALRRGTFEQRKNLALIRKQANQEFFRSQMELREQQEVQAWHIMTWWQKDMTVAKYAKYHSSATNFNLLVHLIAVSLCNRYRW